MEKDFIFFGEGGITATEANRVADMAKSLYTEDVSYLNSISFIDESVETINGEVSKNIAYGIKTLDNIDSKLERIGSLKSLCAWLREAVAAQQRLISESKKYSYDDYIKDNGIECPSRPVQEAPMTENDVIALFDIKKRNRYYYLEAMASTIGGFIHKDCPLDSARKRYYAVSSRPHNLVGNGQDTLIYTYKPSIAKEEIEKTFAELQQKHSSFQKELNSIKSEILSRISNDTIDKTRKYEDELQKYYDASDKINSKYSTWAAENQKKMASLKIVIPNALKDIYEEVANNGKK